MIRRPPRSTLSSSSAASDVYKRQVSTQSTGTTVIPPMSEVQPKDGDAAENKNKNMVKCYVNGIVSEVKDKWEFINEVANSVPEFNNYMGSCAGAGSGDFHMYRASRRKENFRLASMRRDAEKAKAQDNWQQKHDAVQKEHEDQVNKKRDKRKAKQDRQKAAKMAKREEEKRAKKAKAAPAEGAAEPAEGEAAAGESAPKEEGN
eukprot:TRINITY_DN3414_c0_g1_i5.p1 TRINITY_DN3414_c0_g1~~TRINITY_DN3414_c0_g1_i5.p1  ORF type:complete len:204 (-),score=73.19 TRINITY_DN3414_c0_g1_i5:632-1243(-)